MQNGRARLIRRLLLCAALGALTNIAIAWAIAWRSTPTAPWQYRNPVTLLFDRHICFAQRYQQPGLMRVEWSCELRGILYLIDPSRPERKAGEWLPLWSTAWSESERQAAATTHPLPERSGFLIKSRPTRCDDAVGFPCYSLRSTKLSLYDSTEQINLKGAFAIPRNPLGANNREQFALPYFPIWPGFLLNSTLYSVLWFPLLLIPTTLRQRARRRRNACLSCGYDLQGLAPSTPCPECGTPRA